MDLLDAIQFARNRDTQNLIIEAAGAFWLGAELLILHFVLAGRRHLDRSPFSPEFAFTPSEKRRAAAWALVFAAASVAVLGRGLVVPPLHRMLDNAASQRAGPLLDLLPSMYTQRAHTHLALWGALVTGWVLLEVLIVWHGWHGYRRLRGLTGSIPFPRAGTRPSLSLLLFALPAVLFLHAAAPAEPSSALGILQAAHRADAPYRSAMYLYLRVAGIVWIAVEWVAAILLWRAYVLLRRCAAPREKSS